MTIASDLAGLLTGTARVDEGARAKARMALFDLTIAALAGFSTEGAVAARSAARSSWGHGPAPAWFTGEKLSVPGAAFMNAVAGSVVDLDDGHRAAAGHPGASIIPAVLATAAGYGVTEERIPAAIVLGYEIAVRIAASRNFAALTTMVSSPWVGQGAAAAWLRGLGAEATAQAIAIAGASAPNLAAVGYSRVMGNHLKEDIPWATATGLAAVDLAAAGFTGPTDLLDNRSLFSRDVLTGGLGSRWAIEGIYFKPYGCCRWAHAAIDGVLAMRADPWFNAARVESVTVHTFGWAMRLNNERAPRTLELAQYSVPFCVAVAAVHGREALVRLDERMLADGSVLALAARVDLVLDEGYDAMFPAAVPARVVVTTAATSDERIVLAPLGEPTNPLDWSALEQKLATVAATAAISPARLADLCAAIEQLKGGSLGALVDALGTPLT